MDYMKIAEKFGKNIWSVKNKINLNDLLLYGSVIKGKDNPKDIDLLVLHNNSVLDRFHFETMYKEIPNKEKYFILANLLKKQVNIEKIISDKEIQKTIEKNILHPQYLNVSFFHDKEYREKWKKHNKVNKIHKVDEQRNFLNEIFEQGKLWNPETEKYDLNMGSKYNIDF
ncbi:MAG TPA: hypothetical protein VJ912_04365 [Candidatus Nanoarchaeia archaeon]|nr:hypothetical protein [Candidatus Nanoarchaeia archaeon]